jgi:hypothetical protein
VCSQHPSLLFSGPRPEIVEQRTRDDLDKAMELSQRRNYERIEGLRLIER